MCVNNLSLKVNVAEEQEKAKEKAAEEAVVVAEQVEPVLKLLSDFKCLIQLS